MKHARWVPAALLMLAGVAGAQEGFAWRTDLGEARRLAAEEGRPLLVVFR